MRRKFYLSFLAVALSIAATVAFVVGHNSRAKAAPANSALAALPASDFVISVDVRRALNETLPSLLAGNPQLLAKFNSNLEEFQQKTGIDPHVFETIAIGSKLSQVASERRDASTVIIARGSFNSTELINSGFTAAQKECEFQKEEQQYEGHTIYIISSVRSRKHDSGSADKTTGKDQPEDRFGDPRRGTEADVNASAKGTTPVLVPRVEGPHAGAEKIAITAVDEHTIAVGSPESVRAAIDASLGRNRVDDKLVQMASESPNAAVSFSGRIPQGATAKPPYDTPMTKAFASIREFYGSFSASGSDAETLIALRTEKAEEATQISESLNSMKSFAAFAFPVSGNNQAESKTLMDLLNGVTITAQDNEVKISAKFQPASIAPLVHHF